MAAQPIESAPQILLKDKRIPDLNPTAPGTDRATLSVPAFNPATGKTEQTTLGEAAGTVLSNEVRGGEKFVDYFDSRFYGVPGNALTLDRLDPETLVAGNWGTVGNPSDTPMQLEAPSKRYRLARIAEDDTEPGRVLVYKNAGRGTTAKVWCRWVAFDTPEAAAALIPFFNPNADEYRHVSEVKWRVGGDLLVFDTRRNLFKDMFGDDMIPAPTVDDTLNWEQVSPAGELPVLAVTLSTSAARLLISQQKVKAQVRYTLDRRNEPPVQLVGLDPAHYDFAHAVRYDDDSQQWLPGTFDLYDGTEGLFVPGGPSNPGEGTGDVTQAQLAANSLFDRNLANATGLLAAENVTNLVATLQDLLGNDSSQQNRLAALEALVGSLDPDGNNVVDTVREVLALFADFPEAGNLLTLLAGKVNVADLVNNLEQQAPGTALDARQGAVLLARIMTLEAATTQRLLEFVARAGFATEEEVTIGAKQAGTYTTQTLSNVATVAYYKNSVLTPLPFQLAETETLKVVLTRTTDGVGSVVTLST